MSITERVHFSFFFRFEKGNFLSGLWLSCRTSKAGDDCSLFFNKETRKVAQMERGRIMSIKTRLQSKTDREQRNSAIRDLISYEDPVPGELLTSLADLLNEGVAHDATLILKLIAKTKCESLFIAATVPKSVGQPVLTLSPDQGVTLMVAGFKAPSVERSLCEGLNKYGSSEQSPWRRIIVETLRDHGSAACLDTLQMHDYDFYARFKTAELTHTVSPARPDPSLDPGQYLESLVQVADIKYGQLLREAIFRVQERAASPAVQVPNTN